MKMQLWFLLVLFGLSTAATAQKAPDFFSVAEVNRIVSRLSANDMQGRKAGTAGIEKAAQFIATEFKSAGLQTWNNAAGYLQSFALAETEGQEVKGKIKGEEIDQQKIVAITTQSTLDVNEKSGYDIKKITASENLLQEAYALVKENKNYVVLVNEAQASSFGRLRQLTNQLFVSDKSIIFLLTSATAIKEFSIKVKQQVKAIPLANVVGMLPGKTKPNEYVIFSAHYDHLGIGKPVAGDSIYNGANDDAAGTTAVIMLAKYFAHLHNNERTLLFAAFTAEEIGGFGSQYFSRQIQPDKVVAMFNIEMIGTPSRWGKNSAYITGYEKSNMGKIVQNNVKGTAFSFYPDPYPQQQLFYRSDNATLASLGVPAHTISTAKMDAEPYYHSVNDEIETLDLHNMAAIIKAIAESAVTIIAGKDTPTRVQEKE